MFLFNFNGNTYLQVSKLQPSEICDLDFDLSRSLQVKEWPFERASMTSYSTLMVKTYLQVFRSYSPPKYGDLDFDLSRSFQVKANAPFERASMTSYSTLMVTMDLSASVSKLQPSEICLKCALDLTSQGHSRSKPMAAFARACMTSYSTLIVSMRLSVTVWKIQPFENTWPNGHIGHR